MTGFDFSLNAIVLARECSAFYQPNINTHFVSQEIVKTTYVIVKPLRDMLEGVGLGRINLADHPDQLHLGVSMLQEAINQCNTK